MPKICIVTGATSGLGKAIARRLLQEGHPVGIVGRNLEKARESASSIQPPGSRGEAIPLAADLSNLDQVQKLAGEIQERFAHLDLLIHNAGAFYSQRTVTADGTETTLAVNHLAPFYLTHLLIPLLRKSNRPRLLVVGSRAHRQGRIHFEDLDLEEGYGGLAAYAQSKLANLWFIREFARRCPEPAIPAACLDPGLVRTEIGLKHSIWWHRLGWRFLFWIRRSEPPETVAKWIVELAASPSQWPSGKYWGEGKPRFSPALESGDEEARQLWEVSLSKCGIERDYFWNNADAGDADSPA